MMETQFNGVAHTMSQPPVFMPRDTELFFLKLEFYFKQNKFKDESQKLGVLVSAINDPSLSSVIKHVLTNSSNISSPYKELKNKILQETTLSKDEKMDMFLKATGLGDMTPTQFLQYLLSLSPSDDENDPILKAKFMNALSADTQCILATMPDASLSDLAKTADRINNTKKHAPVFINKINTEPNITTEFTTILRSELRSIHQALAEQKKEIEYLKNKVCDNYTSDNNDKSSLSSLCFYHKKFGVNARKCEPSCARYEGKTQLN